MQNKTRGLDRNTWIIIIAFVPVHLSSLNGVLFNRHNTAAIETLDFYLHILTLCGLAVVVTMGILRYRRSE